ISKWAILNRTGARGLKSILEKILLDCNFECPKTGVSYILINESNINYLIKESGNAFTYNGECNAIHYYPRGEQDQFIYDAYKEDKQLGTELDDLFKRRCNNTK
ncbi:hypothetical protein HANVADRAFT_1623, partial [Hanseniaspora valbyensis NRRL Y-1626]